MISVCQYKQTIDNILNGCNCIQIYKKSIDDRIHDHSVCSYTSNLYPELAECGDIRHKNSMNLIINNLLETFAYQTRDYYLDENSILRQKNIIFKENGFFHSMEYGNFNNFIIKKSYTHSDGLPIKDLMDGQYNEISCCMIEYSDSNILDYDIYQDEDTQIYLKLIPFKWDDIKTTDIIDKFLEYEFNEDNFRDFIKELFCDGDIMFCFNILNMDASIVIYTIKIPFEESKKICVKINTGFISI